MKAKSSNSWLFPLRFLLFFALTYIIWDFTAPVGTKVFSYVAGNIVLAIDDAGHATDIFPYEKYIVVQYPAARDGKPLSLEYKGFTFNTVLLVALIMAVPRVDYKLRLKLLILGLIILFPIQIFRLVVYIFNFFCRNIKRSDGSFIYPAYLYHSIGYVDKTLIRIDGQIIPVLIWSGLYYYYKWHNIFTKLRKAESSS